MTREHAIASVFAFSGQGVLQSAVEVETVRSQHADHSVYR